MDLRLPSTSSSSSGTLLTSIQKVALTWERLLFASGGALAIQKCFYYLLDWCWDYNSFPVLSSNTTLSDPQLGMTLGRSTSTHTIPRVINNTWKRAPGVLLSPDELFKDKFTYCQQQALKWIHNISMASLSREEAYTVYCTMWQTSFEFPLPVTLFTKKQWKTLQRVFTGPFLAKNGNIQKNLLGTSFSPILT